MDTPSQVKGGTSVGGCLSGSFRRDPGSVTGVAGMRMCGELGRGPIEADVPGIAQNTRRMEDAEQETGLQE